MFGRADRDGSKAQAHLFYNDKKKGVDTKLQTFYDSKEKTCRREVLLEGVGGEYCGGLESCCDICTSSASRADLKLNLSVVL